MINITFFFFLNPSLFDPSFRNRNKQSRKESLKDLKNKSQKEKTFFLKDRIVDFIVQFCCQHYYEVAVIAQHAAASWKDIQLFSINTKLVR